MFRFYLNHYQVRFYIKHDADHAPQQQTLVMFPYTWKKTKFLRQVVVTEDNQRVDTSR
jgi:hypothetical protein